MYHWAVHRLAQRVLAYSRKRELLCAGDRVGIAVSGGADSVALLRLMLELRAEIGLVLSVVHLNHQLRGAESIGDETFAGELAATYGLDFICERRNVNAHAAGKSLSLEAAARALRYEFFRKTLESGSCSKIATAHTLDDQAETVLLKMARGAGTRGMAGIWPEVAVNVQRSASIKTDASIVRPVLDTARADLRTYLSSLGQTWREDSTNRDLRHTRNRIRHGILPRVERHVNPNIRETLAETAEVARAEEEYWVREVERLLPQLWRDAALDRTKLEAVPLAFQRRLVRAAAESLGMNLEFCHVEEILGLGPNGRAALPNARSAQRCGDSIKFDEVPNAGSDYGHLLPVPGELEIPEIALTLETQLVTDSDSGSLLESRFAQRELIVRNWRPGERFWPAHTKQPQKIKELLQDRKIIGDQKRNWPVIAGGGEIVWMRGFGVRRDFQAKDGRGILIRERDSRHGQ